MKEVLTWFTHDADAHENPRMQAVLANYGFEGYGRFWALNERIAKAKKAQLDISTKVLKSGLANVLRMTPAELDAFLTFLADPEECGLLHWENGILTTDRTQRDLSRAMSERQRDADRRKGVIDYEIEEPDGEQEKPAGKEQKPEGLPREKPTHYRTLQDTRGTSPQGASSDLSPETKNNTSAGAREAPAAVSTKPGQEDSRTPLEFDAKTFVLTAVATKRQEQHGTGPPAEAPEDFLLRRDAG